MTGPDLFWTSGAGCTQIPKRPYLQFFPAKRVNVAQAQGLGLPFRRFAMHHRDTAADDGAVFGGKRQKSQHL